MSTLKKRIMTASILLPVIVFTILFAPPVWFSIAAIFVFLLAIIEWTRLAGFNQWWSRAIATFLIPFLFFVLLIGLNYFVQDQFLMYQRDKPFGVKHYTSELLQWGLGILMLAGWLLALLAVYFYPKGSKLYQSKTAGILIGCFVLMPAFFSLIALQYVAPSMALYVLILIWAADIGAYFAGKKFGHHKLAPLVSPGKTWEGVWGALAATCIVIIAGYFFFNIQISFFLWLSINLLTVLFSIVGDLFESLFKRLRHLKDSSQLLPGHGGILDRIDSLTSALPIFTLSLMAFY